MKLESTEKEAPLLSEQQRKAHWLFCQHLADTLTEHGVSQKVFMEKAKHFDVPIDKDFVHELWLYIQNKLFGTTSTTKLTKNEGQIQKIHDVLMKGIGETFEGEIPYVDFPSTCYTCKHLDCVCKHG